MFAPHICEGFKCNYSTHNVDCPIPKCKQVIRWRTCGWDGTHHSPCGDSALHQVGASVRGQLTRKKVHRFMLLLVEKNGYQRKSLNGGPGSSNHPGEKAKVRELCNRRLALKFCFVDYGCFCANNGRVPMPSSSGYQHFSQ